MLDGKNHIQSLERLRYELPYPSRTCYDERNFIETDLMIYLASRSCQKYLNKLREISNRPGYHHIVSITGGLAFIHALSAKTISLQLIDSDPEVTEYGQIMLEIILACPSRPPLLVHPNTDSLL